MTANLNLPTNSPGPRPRLSVVMPVYNGERYLPLALDSVLSQSFADFELLALDDGSTDATWAMLSAYADRDPRVRPSRNPANWGVQRTLNRGLALAHGDYIARQDSDDLSLPERFARQVAFLDAHPAVGLVGSLTQDIDADGAPLGFNVFPRALDNAEIQQQLLLGCCLCHGSVMLRREALASVGAYDEAMEEAEDYDLWLRLAEKWELFNLAQPLYAFRLHSASVSQRRRAQVAVYVAHALEKATQRRFGPSPTPEQLAYLARAELAAALAYWAAREAAAAQQLLRQALRHTPALLNQPEPLHELWLTHGARPPLDQGLAFTNSLFRDLLPRTWPLHRQRQQMLAELHMRAAFAALGQGQTRLARGHLWQGVLHNQAWLRNRGVIVLLAKSVLAH